MKIEVITGLPVQLNDGEYRVEAIHSGGRQSEAFQRITLDWKQILADVHARAYSGIRVFCPDETTCRLCKQVYNFWYPSGKNECILDPQWSEA